MASWADDPELLATFRAEVEDRLASLQAGLLSLEGAASPRQAVAQLFRDAHTVKGSARMLGLDVVVHVAHSVEDLLGAVRDGRLPVRKDLVDLLLVACDGIARVMPGAAAALEASALDPLREALSGALAGDEPVRVPALAEAPADDEAAEPDGAAAGTGGAVPGESVRVSAAKVYDLLDVVGEAELGARRVEQSAQELHALATEIARWAKTARDAAAAAGAGLPGEVAAALARLAGAGDGVQAQSRVLRELVEGHLGRVADVRDGAMGLAMVPVRRVTAALPRLVRDVATATGKDVRLEVVGDDVELDKQVLDGIADALKHLVINAVDHGCEAPAARLAAGKPSQAVVRLAARSAGGTVVVEVGDDGSGIEEDAVRAVAVARGLLPADSTATGPALLSVLFATGFSTNDEVTETSGRGVGLDVVRAAVEDLGGTVEVSTAAGAGTTFRLTLPVTLGVLRCLVARVGAERYAVPVPGVVESVSLRDADVAELAGAPVVVRHGVSVPLLDLGAVVGAVGDRAPRAALVVRHGDRQVAWAVDRLEGELELVVKDLGSYVGRLPLVAGANIDGDGSVVCLLDLRGLAARLTAGEDLPSGVVLPAQRAAVGDGATGAPAAAPRRPRVLVVEDSVGVRELERAVLTAAGYDVDTAVDGLDGAARLTGEPADLVVSDVEMPGMDGFALTRTVRGTAGWANVPVVIMTSCGDEADRRAGLEAGANAYLLKQEFDQAELVSTVRRLVGR